MTRPSHALCGTPTPEDAERLAARLELRADDHAERTLADMIDFYGEIDEKLDRQAAAALRSHAALQRERDEARRMLAEAEAVIACEIGHPTDPCVDQDEHCHTINEAIRRHAAAKEKPDEQ